MKSFKHHPIHQRALDTEESRLLMHDIAAGNLTAEQTAYFTAVLNHRGITPDELRGFSRCFRELLLPFRVDIDSIDIVGTGGDGKNTFNISTCTCFVVAAAGYPVTKHGSFGVSSTSGSSDVLLELGYQFSTDHEVLHRQLERYKLTFLHAPLWHPAMKRVVPVRRNLGLKTVFNLLGPLLNPANPTHALLGTATPTDAHLYQQTLKNSDKRSFAVVHALDGYDEISLTDQALVLERDRTRQLGPADFGLPAYAPEALHGGETVAEAAGIFRNILQNRATAAQRDAVLANAGLAISLFEPDLSLPDCVRRARTAIESGATADLLERLLADGQ